MIEWDKVEEEKELMKENIELEDIPFQKGDTSFSSTNQELKQNEVEKQTVLQKNTHPILTIGLSTLLGLGAGFGGGYMAYQHFQPEVPTPTVIQTQTVTPAVVEKTTNELTIQQIAAKASPSVVEITTETQTNYGYFGGSRTATAAGSGVIISADGYIITNSHVVNDATAITIKLYDGKEYEAELIGTDTKSDIAVIKVNGTGFTPATIGDSSIIQVGDTAIVIGNPLGTLGGTVTNGIISAIDRELTINRETMNLIQTNAAINSGNSGGGLFDGYGQLIGIVNAKDSGFTSSGSTIEGLGFAIPINEAYNVATQLIQSGYVTDRPTIGVQLSTVTQNYGQYQAGLYITKVLDHSAAQEAGLAEGDQIIGVDDISISSYEELSYLLNHKQVGDTITIIVLRDGEEKQFPVTLKASQATKSNE